jgi:hypothetical protein
MRTMPDGIDGPMFLHPFIQDADVELSIFGERGISLLLVGMNRHRPGSAISSASA